MSLTLKLFSLAVRTAAKPISNWIKHQAHEHESFRRYCVNFAQRLHRFDMRMRLGLLQDPEAIERQIAKETEREEAKRLKSQHRPTSSTPTAKTEVETRTDEQAKKKERETAEKKVKNQEKKRNERMIRPLSEGKAIDAGANFISEAFVFGVGVALILFESWRSKRKDSNRREDVQDRLESLEEEVKKTEDEKVVLEDRVGSLMEEIERLKNANAMQRTGGDSGSSSHGGAPRNTDSSNVAELGRPKSTPSDSSKDQNQPA